MYRTACFGEGERAASVDIIGGFAEGKQTRRMILVNKDKKGGGGIEASTEIRSGRVF